MGTTLTLALNWLRAYAASGVPLSGINEPAKLDGIATLTDADTRLTNLETFSAHPNVPDPTTALNPVNLEYFNANAPALFNFTTAVNAATTAALPANTYANGTAGVGATLTGTTNAALAAQDGVTLTVNQRLLVKNEAAQANNGIYALTQVGTGSAPYILTRTTDANTPTLLGRVAATVLAGTVNAGIAYGIPLAGTAITVGTTALNLVNLPTGGPVPAETARAEAAEAVLTTNLATTTTNLATTTANLATETARAEAAEALLAPLAVASNISILQSRITKLEGLSSVTSVGNGFFNATLANTTKLRTALANAKAGTISPQASMGFMGDSLTTSLVQIGSTGSYTTLRSNCWVTFAAAKLAALGFPTSTDSFYGASITNIGGVGVVDPRVSTTWGGGNVSGLGGLDAGATTGTPIATATPDFAIDSALVIWQNFPGGVCGSFNVLLDGSVIDTISTNAAASAQKKSYTFAHGTHTFAIQKVADGLILAWDGMTVWDSTASRFGLEIWGGNGYTTLSLVDSGDAPRGYINQVVARAAPVVGILIGPNDWRTGVSVATYQANLIALVQAVQGYGGECHLFVPIMSNYTAVADPPLLTQQQYINAVYSVAMTLSCCLMDFNALLGGSPSVANSNGYLGADMLHSTIAGYTLMGQTWAQAAANLLNI